MSDEGLTSDSETPLTTAPMWRRLAAAIVWLGTAGLMLQAILIALAARWWFADLLTHFRCQELLASVVLLVIGIGLKKWYPATVLALIAAWHGWAIAPYFPTHTDASRAASSQSLLAWNVFVGNLRHDEIVSVIREVDADIVLLMEVSPDLAAKLHELSDLYPTIETLPSHNPFGIAILCREPNVEVDLTPIGDSQLSAIVMKLNNGVTFIGAHTMPPMGSHLSELRNRQLRDLGNRITAQQEAVVVAGDLNISPWSPHFQNLLAKAALHEARRGRGVLNTWPAGQAFTRIPIDHVLTTSTIDVEELQVLADSHGSDHYPVVCRWSLRPAVEREADRE